MPRAVRREHYFLRDYLMYIIKKADVLTKKSTPALVSLRGNRLL